MENAQTGSGIHPTQVKGNELEYDLTKPRIPEPQVGDLVGYRSKKGTLRTYRVMALDGQGEELIHIQLFGPPSFLFWVLWKDLDESPTQKLSTRWGRR